MQYHVCCAVEQQSLLNPDGFRWPWSFEQLHLLLSNILVLGIQKRKVNNVAHQVPQ